jgi:hypothetical protein
MRRVLIILFFLISEFAFTQTVTPFFEQIAFDLYRSEIIDSFPVKKRIRIFPSFFDFQSTEFSFLTPNCFNKVAWTNPDHIQQIKEYKKNQHSIDSNYKELDFTDLNKKQFKIKKNGKGSYPKLFISVPHEDVKKPNRILVNIYEKHSKRKTVIYHLLLDKNGDLKEWCRQEFITYIIH